MTSRLTWYFDTEAQNQTRTQDAAFLLPLHIHAYTQQHPFPLCIVRWGWLNPTRECLGVSWLRHLCSNGVSHASLLFPNEERQPGCLKCYSSFSFKKDLKFVQASGLGLNCEKVSHTEMHTRTEKNVSRREPQGCESRNVASWNQDSLSVSWNRTTWKLLW